MTLVRVGRLGRPHGLLGEIALDRSDLTTEELIAIGTFVWRDRDGETETLTLRSARSAYPRILVAFAGYGLRATVARLTNGELLADDTSLPDPGPETVYQYQLLGLAVVTDEGRALGEVVDAFPTGAHWIYVVRGERELMIPATDQTVKEIDLEAGRIVVTLPAGLEEAQ
jgi:16S rRNA processing protein RimM